MSQAPSIEETEGGSLDLDPQSSLSLVSAAVNSHRDDVIYLRLRERQHPIRCLHVEYTGDEYLDYEERMRVSRAFLGRRALDSTTSPLIWEWGDAGLEVVQRSGAPLWWWMYCYQPETPQFQQMMNCYLEAKLGQISFFSRTQLRNETSPALRLVEPVCRDPHFQVLCGNDSLHPYMQAGWATIVEAGGLNWESRRTICMLLETDAMTFCENNECKFTVRTDEAEAFSLLSPDVMRWWLTLRKQGVDMTKIVQSMSMDEQTLTQLLQGANRFEFFRCGPEMAAKAARYLVASTYDPNALWYEHNETPHYMMQGQQEAIIARRLMQLPTGTRYVSEHGKVWQESVKLPSIFISDGLWRRKAERAIARWRRANDNETWNDFWQSM